MILVQSWMERLGRPWDGNWELMEDHDGIFGLTRNPIYAAWIVFIIPGLAMFSRSWPMMLTPIVAFVTFKIWIRRENEYLEKRFGDAYREYRARANEFVPWPRR